MIDLTKLTPAPWEADETRNGVRIVATTVEGARGTLKTVCAHNTNGADKPAHALALANLAFIALARNAFDGDPEALAWWKANRKRRAEEPGPSPSAWLPEAVCDYNAESHPDGTAVVGFQFGGGNFWRGKVPVETAMFFEVGERYSFQVRKVQK